MKNKVKNKLKSRNEKRAKIKNKREKKILQIVYQSMNNTRKVYKSIVDNYN